MKLNISQLEQQVEKQLAPLYLISGDDPILKQDALLLIRKAAKQNGYSERVRLSAESGLDEQQLYTTLYSPSLSADKTLVELDFRGKLPGKPITAIVEDYLAKPSSEIVVLIDTNKLEDTAARSSWYKAIEKLGTVVTIWPVTREQLPQWIMQRGKKYKLTIQQDAASLLADYVEGNLTAATQAVEKIYLLKHDKPINAELIQSILADESRFTIFDLTEAMIGDNQARTLHILDTLEQDGMEPVIVLWGITRELRQLSEMGTLQQQGVSWDEIFRKHRVFPRRQNGVRRFLGRFSPQKCRDCLTHAASVDSILKGGSPGNGWEALQMLCLRLV